MAKLVRKQRESLERALYHLNRAKTYLDSPRVAVCVRDSVASTSLHYKRDSDSAVLYEVAKDIGSDLCGLEFAADTLRKMLESGQ